MYKYLMYPLTCSKLDLLPQTKQNIFDKYIQCLLLIVDEDLMTILMNARSKEKCF